MNERVKAMKIIDAHLHFSDREGFKKTAREIAEVPYTAQGLRNEYKSANVVAGIVMTSPGREGSLTPSGKSRELMLEDGTLDNLFACVGINPVDLSKDPKSELYYIEGKLNLPYVTGIKLYPGYFPTYVTDSLYNPIYKLAQKYEVPVAIHTGDTSSPRGQLKYSHPLTIDELAVKYQKINFIICHFGDPWVLDAAELVSKNLNVYADLSGFIAGNAQFVQERIQTPLYLDHFRQAFIYSYRYDKLMFGTDWPIVPVAPYVEFIKAIIPKEHHQDVFFNNAKRLYPKLKSL
jgi:predicted TIM-barrel fold metal-dependent hydrolase